MAVAAANTALNKSVWASLYSVTPQQSADPAWLALDSDGDAVSNQDEILAGTNPFDVQSVFAIISMQPDATTGGFLVTLPTQLGKQYKVLSSPRLGSGAVWTDESPFINGTGADVVIVTRKPAGTVFYRGIVRDMDTDGDTVCDWVEYILGFDPTKKNSGGSPTDDLTAIKTLLGKENHVTIEVGTPIVSAYTTPVSSTTFVVKRSGDLLFNSITIPLLKQGTAVENVDYNRMATRVTMAPGVSSVDVKLTPRSNPNRTRPVTATLIADVCGGYTVDERSRASVMLAAPAQAPKGTGLTGYYYRYPKPLLGGPPDFDAAFTQSTLYIKRLDPTLNFYWGTATPPFTDLSTYYSIRWKGQIEPEFTGTYTFTVRADDGVKLWVDGKLLIDKWIIQGATNYDVNVDMTAGTRYSIQIEYFQVSGASEMRLYWTPPNRSREVIPAVRLYPDSTPDPLPQFAEDSSRAIGFNGQPFNYAAKLIGGKFGTVNFALDSSSAPLPPGLTLDPVTGLISGKPTVPGDYQIVIKAFTNKGSSTSILNLVIKSVVPAISQESWMSLADVAVGAIPLGSAPNYKNTYSNVSGLEDTHPYSVNYGVRLRGYFTAPSTGNYYFWISSSSPAEFWLSNDSLEANKVRRAWVTAGTGPRIWNAPNQPNQKSAWISLVGGEKYYYEILKNSLGVDSDHAAVGFMRDDTGRQPAIGNGTGVIPGYLLTAYDYPATYAAAGTLYATHMAPQGAATSKGYGSASLRLNTAKTQAILYYNYSGLTSGFSAAHVHTEAYNGKSSQIVFDIDDAVRFHPEKRTPDGGLIWDIADIGLETAAEIVAALESGRAYINVHSAKYPDGEIRGNFAKIEGSQVQPVRVPGPAYVSDHNTDFGAARFLGQAAFGASPQDIASVKSLGFAAWIDAQMAMGMTDGLLSRVNEWLVNAVRLGDSNQGLKTRAWWESAINSDQQLRFRVAFALSEIMVVGAGSDRPIGSSAYYDVLLKNAFGNYRDLLKDITLNPTMGNYLNMRGNQKGDPATGRIPNENYAREIMQLFSIGLNRLWPDGTIALDAQGNIIPTYSQNVVEGMAKVFTGWNYWADLQANGRLPYWSGGWNMEKPMVMVPRFHDLGVKLLLNNEVAPAAINSNINTTDVYTNPLSPYNGMNAYDVGGLIDLDVALDSILRHPNVGPFISKQLIQRLVTSNPSPGYVERVARVFNDGGAPDHARGNLGKVIRAILLDGEARGTQAALSSPTYGKMREPMVRMTSLARTFPITPVSGRYAQTDPDSFYISVTTDKPHLLSANQKVQLAIGGKPNSTTLRYPSGSLVSGVYTVAASNLSGNTFEVRGTDYDVGGFEQKAGSKTVTIFLSGEGNAVIGYTGKNYFNFPSSSGIPDGTYTITAAPGANNVITIEVPNAPAVAIKGSVMRPSIGVRKYVFVENVGEAGGPQVRVLTQDHHILNVNDKVWISFPPATRFPGGEFKVTEVPTSGSFICKPLYAMTFPANGSAHDSGIFPLIPLPPRSGTLSLEFSNYWVSRTNDQLLQTPLESQTVFNFFMPDYQFPGELAQRGLVTPEFQLLTDSSIVALTNTFTKSILGGYAENHNGFGMFSNYAETHGGQIFFDFTPYTKPPYSVADASGVTAVVKKFADILGTKLEDATINRITTLVSTPANFPATATNADKVREILYLIVTSAEYSIQR